MKFIVNTNHFASYNFAKNIYLKYQLLLHCSFPINFVHIQFNNANNVTILPHNIINKRPVYYKTISNIYQNILKFNLHLQYFSNNNINLPSEKKLTTLINNYSNILSQNYYHQTDFSDIYTFLSTSAISSRKNDVNNSRILSQLKFSLPANFIINNLVISGRNNPTEILKERSASSAFGSSAQAYFASSEIKQIQTPLHAAKSINKFNLTEYKQKYNHFSLALNKLLVNVHEGEKVGYVYSSTISKLIAPSEGKIFILTKLANFKYAEKIKVVTNKIVNETDKSSAKKAINLPIVSKFVLLNSLSDSRIYQDVLHATDSLLQQTHNNNYLNFHEQSNHRNIIKRYVKSKIKHSLDISNFSKYYEQLQKTIIHISNKFSNKIISNNLNSIFKNNRYAKVNDSNKVINNFHEKYNQNTIVHQDQLISYINNQLGVKTNRLNDITLLNKVVNNNYIGFDRSTRINQSNDIFYTKNHLILKNNTNHETISSSKVTDDSYIKNDKNLVANQNDTVFHKEDNAVSSDQAPQPISVDLIAEKVYKIFERKLAIQKNRRGHR